MIFINFSAAHKQRYTKLSALRNIHRIPPAQPALNINCVHRITPTLIANKPTPTYIYTYWYIGLFIEAAGQKCTCFIPALYKAGKTRARASAMELNSASETFRCPPHCVCTAYAPGRAKLGNAIFVYRPRLLAPALFSYFIYFIHPRIHTCVQCIYIYKSE